MKYILKSVLKYLNKLDKLLLLMCAGICSFSVILLYTLNENNISGAVSAGQYKTQLVASIIGIVAALIIAAINYKFISKIWFLYTPAALIFTMLLFTSLGVQNEGANDIGWLNLGFIQFQPSELLKVAFILTFATHLSKVGARMNEPIQFILLCIHGAIPTLLIMKTGDDGSALVFLFMFIAMMFVAGVSWKYMVIAGVATPPIIYVIWNYLMQPHQILRFKLLFDTQIQEQEWLGLYMQQRLGKIALGSGQLTGLGLSGGKYTYVPEIHNDFIFSYIGMTLGLLGCAATVLILAAICVKILSVGSSAKDSLGKYICVGVFSMILFHSIANIGMVLGVMPVIGIPLPFISAGGTSIISLFCSLGLVLSVGVHNSKKYHMFYSEKE